MIDFSIDMPVKSIDSNYLNFIELSPKHENKWLKLERVILSGNNRMYADGIIEVSFEDRQLSKVQKLATYKSGRWIFATKSGESLFWKHVKENYSEFKNYFRQLKTPLK